MTLLLSLMLTGTCYATGAITSKFMPEEYNSITSDNQKVFYQWFTCQSNDAKDKFGDFVGTLLWVEMTSNQANVYYYVLDGKYDGKNPAFSSKDFLTPINVNYAISETCAKHLVLAPPPVTAPAAQTQPSPEAIKKMLSDNFKKLKAQLNGVAKLSPTTTPMSTTGTTARSQINIICNGKKVVNSNYIFMKVDFQKPNKPTFQYAVSRTEPSGYTNNIKPEVIKACKTK